MTWWDETHPKVEIGDNAGKKTQTRFARGPNGRLDINGKLNPKKYWLRHKYNNEIRIMPGCAMRRDADGQLRGYRLATWDYTGCWVHSIGTFEDVHVPAQIKRIKQGGPTGWVEGRRPKTRIRFLSNCRAS